MISDMTICTITCRYTGMSEFYIVIVYNELARSVAVGFAVITARLNLKWLV